MDTLLPSRSLTEAWCRSVLETLFGTMCSRQIGNQNSTHVLCILPTYSHDLDMRGGIVCWLAIFETQQLRALCATSRQSSLSHHPAALGQLLSCQSSILILFFFFSFFFCNDFWAAS